jgi:hypothetical protein
MHSEKIQSLWPRLPDRALFVNTPLRSPARPWYKKKPSRVVWLAGRFIRISRRSSGI